MLTLPIWLVLIAEVIGDSFYNTPLRTGRFRNVIVMGTATVAAISPAFWAAAALFGISGSRAQAAPRRWKRAIWLILILAFLSTMYSCAMSCGGHPTWIRGYDGSFHDGSLSRHP
ncbi:MAG: hypothetical protein WCC99_23380 [Candidatus Sulfotelmatobacter sp.]